MDVQDKQDILDERHDHILYILSIHVNTTQGGNHA